MKGKSVSFFFLQYLARLFHTLRFLKWQQFFFRIYYPVKRIFYKPKKIAERHLETSFSQEKVQFPSFSLYSKLYDAEEHTFTFLNRSKSFSGPIDWEFSDYGLLWTFHLHYFDWLNDSIISIEDRLNTLKDYTNQYANCYIFHHSYPSSLRIVNSIKFLIEHNIKDEKLAGSLYKQASRLSAFPEYEIGANHLLMNGLALIWAGIYFDEPEFEIKGKNILNKELTIQILNDGIHFEKSPAYQSVIVKELLSLLILLRVKLYDNQYIKYIDEICYVLLSGLATLVAPDGSYMNFGDANNEMSILFAELLIVAQNLHIKVGEVKPDESGFRLKKTNQFELLVNTGNIPATFQPGHAHADAFSFCLNSRQKQIIVDRGVSTYESSLLRLEEKSTAAHNTVCIEGKNTADVWSSFRLGKRPNVYMNKIGDEVIDYKHDAYKKGFGIIHRRKFEFQENSIDISDELEGWYDQSAQLFLHFHPEIVLERIGEKWMIKKEGVSILIENCTSYVEDYEYCVGFNKTKTAQRIVGNIHSMNIKTVIKFF